MRIGTAPTPLRENIVRAAMAARQGRRHNPEWVKGFMYALRFIWDLMRAQT
jgi:hypothetical protein